MIKGRREEDKYLPGNLFEGMISLKAVCRSRNGRKVVRAYFDASRMRKRAADYGLLLRLGEMHGFPVDLVDKQVIDSMTVGSSHGGIVAECTDVDIPAFSPEAVPPRGFLFLVDGVEDPYNFGFILRSLYAAGADAVLLTERNWMSAAGVVCRSSAGASELIPLYVCDPPSAVSQLKARGYLIVASEMERSIPLSRALLARPLLMALGGEKRGIGKEVLELADERVRIEYGRECDLALSSVSAASVLAFEALRRIGPSGGDH